MNTLVPIFYQSGSVDPELHALIAQMHYMVGNREAITIAYKVMDRINCYGFELAHQAMKEAYEKADRVGLNEEEMAHLWFITRHYLLFMSMARRHAAEEIARGLNHALQQRAIFRLEDRYG